MYRRVSHDAVVARFNERFILSLGSCDDCLVLDDELNVLPISRGKNIEPLEDGADADPQATKASGQLKELKDSLADSKPAGPLVGLTKTTDQARALLTFIDSVAIPTSSASSSSSSSPATVVTLTAARGRGKSAALGLAVAGAIAHGYANIFVTSPSPENLKTFFEFLFKGLDALEWEENREYDVMQSTNPEWNKAIVRVNLYREHRQTVQVSFFYLLILFSSTVYADMGDG